MSFYIYIKWKFDYPLFVRHIQFFLDSLEIQANQRNIHTTLTIQKVVLVLNDNCKKNFKNDQFAEVESLNLVPGDLETALGSGET